MQLAFCHDVADSGRDKDDDGKHGLNAPPARARVNAQAADDSPPVGFDAWRICGKTHCNTKEPHHGQHSLPQRQAEDAGWHHAIFSANQDFARLRRAGALMAKPIEIRVGPKLIWKDGAPGPAYAELQCNAWENDPGEGRVVTYRGEKPPVPGPACEVVSGAPFVDYSLSLRHATDDVMALQIDITKQDPDGWRVYLSDAYDEGDGLDGWVRPWADDGEGGEVPGAPAKIVVGPDGSVKVFTRPVVWVGDEEVVTGPATLALSFSAAEISAALDVSLAGMYPAKFDTFGGEGPPPEPTGFWTGFRKCHEA